MRGRPSLAICPACSAPIGLMGLGYQRKRKGSIVVNGIALNPAACAV